MKPVITKEEVGKAISQLVGQGKKPTLATLHAALGNKGSMSTLVRLKAEIDAEAQPATDSLEPLAGFREVWALAHDEGRKGQEQVTADLRDSLKAIAAENERLEGATVAAQKRAIDLEEAKSKAEAELNQFRISADHELSQAMSTMREAGLQTAKALQELADARGAHATHIAALSADLTIAQRNAHDFELQLVRVRALLEAKGQASESSLLGEPVKIEQRP